MKLTAILISSALLLSAACTTTNGNKKATQKPITFNCQYQITGSGQVAVTWLISDDRQGTRRFGVRAEHTGPNYRCTRNSVITLNVINDNPRFDRDHDFGCRILVNGKVIDEDEAVYPDRIAYCNGSLLS